jgi:hypothetical protein
MALSDIFLTICTLVGLYWSVNVILYSTSVDIEFCKQWQNETDCIHLSNCQCTWCDSQCRAEGLINVFAENCIRIDECTKRNTLLQTIQSEIVFVLFYLLFASGFGVNSLFIKAMNDANIGPGSRMKKCIQFIDDYFPTVFNLQADTQTELAKAKYLRLLLNKILFLLFSYFLITEGFLLAKNIASTLTWTHS